MTAAVEFLNVSRHFGAVKAVDGVDLTIVEGSFFAMLGPSGSGKTTCLRLISGFEQPTGGAIRIFGEDVSATPPHLRAVNTVFQDYALFPHLNVRDNVAYGLMVKGMARAPRYAKAEEMLALVHLDGYGDRKPAQLSGGQRQRVALARALVNEPRVLLLAEPLGALDLKLRKEMQLELKRLQREVGITFVFVTHDQEEALTMSDRIAVMNQGRVEQLDESVRVFEYPRTEFVAQFMGANNFFRGVVNTIAEGLLELGAGADSAIRVPHQGIGLRPNDEVRFVVRPEKLDLRTKAGTSDGEVSIEVTVEDRVYQGVNTVWVVRSSTNERYFIYEQNDQPFREHNRFRVGGKAFMSWNPRHTVVLEKPHEATLAS